MQENVKDGILKVLVSENGRESKCRSGGVKVESLLVGESGGERRCWAGWLRLWVNI